MKKVRTPDRFERMVKELYFGKFEPRGDWRTDKSFSAGAPIKVISLLRRQHQNYRQQIKNMMKLSEEIADNYTLGLQTREFHQMRIKIAEDILFQLEQYKI